MPEKPAAMSPRRRPRRPIPRRRIGYAPWLLVPGSLAALFLLVPLVAVAARTPWADFWPLISSEGSRVALWLSVKTCLVSTLCCVVLGVPLAMVLAKLPDSWWARAVRTVVTLPMMLPPVVAGLALLLTWGRRGLIGQHLTLLGIEIGFTTLAVIMAQTFVAMPFLVSSLEGAIRAGGEHYEEAARALGASRTRTFFQVTMPVLLPAFISATAICFSRALGEFGATITFAGSLQGVTQTMPLAIYLQRQVNTEQALALAVMLILLAIAAIFGANMVAARLPGMGGVTVGSGREHRARAASRKLESGAGAADADTEGADVGEGSAGPIGGARGTGPGTAGADAGGAHPDTGSAHPEMEGASAHQGTSPRITIRAAVTARGAQYDIEIPGGDLTAIMGPNGAGKSTMLELVAGSLQPDTGGVTFDPADVTVTILQQKPLLFPHMSVQANVEFGLRCRGVGKPEARQRATSELAQVRCGALVERRPHQLSGGQAQRVAIARAMAIDPDVVLLDEPMAGLDEESASQVRAQLRERLAGSGATALLVTHDPVDAEELAARTILIRHGRVERVAAR